MIFLGQEEPIFGLACGLYEQGNVVGGGEDRVVAPDRSVEQALYWDKCTRMNFHRLSSFISDSLEALSWPGSADGRPRSKGDFLALWNLLGAKVDTVNMTEPLPVPTELPQFPPFAPSEHLWSLLDQRKQLVAALTQAQGNASSSVASRTRKRQRKRKLKSLELDISRSESRERRKYAERREAYFRPYFRSYLEAKAARERGLRRQEKQLQFVKVRKKIEHAFSSKLTSTMKRLAWRVLPPGELSADAVRRHYDTLQRRNPEVRYERERITKALSLQPEHYYVGRDEFEGYIVLTFARTPKVMMECPIFGNAIYITKSDWKRLSRMSKRELLACGSGQFTKIVHKGDWFRRVKLELGIR